MNNSLGSVGQRVTPPTPTVAPFNAASAKDYGKALEKRGFEAVAVNSCIEPQKGDVAIIQDAKGHPHGHIAIFNGKDWVSDYVQKNKTDGLGGMYPGNAYRKEKPDVTIYRAKEKF